MLNSLEAAITNDQPYIVIIADDENYNRTIHGNAKQLLALSVANINDLCAEINYPIVSLLETWLEIAKNNEKEEEK